MTRQRIVLVLLVATAAGVAIGLAVALAAGTSQPTLVGVTVDRPVPNVSLLDERGRPVSLASFRGTAVVLAPTLTFCHEVCPITSGALQQVLYDGRRSGLVKYVTVLEVSVDPWRDSPARLRAYRRLTGVDFRLLTGTHAALTRFWRFFGVGFYPTGQGKSFDVAHTDGVFFVDESGHWRIAIIGMSDVRGKLDPRLRRLLGQISLRNLAHPKAAWTVDDVLTDLSSLVGRRIPNRPLP